MDRLPCVFPYRTLPSSFASVAPVAPRTTPGLAASSRGHRTPSICPSSRVAPSTSSRDTAPWRTASTAFRFHGGSASWLTSGVSPSKQFRFNHLCPYWMDLDRANNSPGGFQLWQTLNVLQEHPRFVSRGALLHADLPCLEHAKQVLSPHTLVSVRAPR